MFGLSPEFSPETAPKTNTVAKATAVIHAYCGWTKSCPTETMVETMPFVGIFTVRESKNMPGFLSCAVQIDPLLQANNF